MSAESGGGKVRLFFREAIARALAEEMERDERLLVLGQDVGAFGGAYKEFAGLHETFGPDRMRDTPVAEAAMVGLGAGAAAMGHRTLVSITYMDFMTLGLDPLVNYAAKARFKTAGRITVPLVVKTTAGAKGQGVAHSQCLESWLMGVPGLKVVAPSDPASAYGLLKSALREEGPVVFIDHKRLFPKSGDVSSDEWFAPIGKARRLREGDDVTVVTHGYMVHVAMEAAQELSEAGIGAEVIDLRSLAPLDAETIAASVAKTGALATLEEGQVTCGVGSEVAFRVMERLGPVRAARVGPLPAPVSSNPVLEAACLPDADRLVAAVHQLLGQAKTKGTA
ncbi:MAG: transketolase C-terminal domain-containing protein [Novosphingobium sp.]|nr:alpha-ketoacid dehydrogenase subunit beta [Novosphingobium sp.]